MKPTLVDTDILSFFFKNNSAVVKKLSAFLSFASRSNVIMLTINSVTFASNIYAQLRKQGDPIDDIDILIAGIALSHDMVLATCNISHFGRIDGLQIEDWSKES